MLKFWQYFLVLLFIFSLYFLFPKLSFADWPGPRYDFDKSGAVPYQISEQPQQIWVTGNLGFLWNPPTVDSAGNIYLGTDIGGVISLDKNGTKKWAT
ncbi:MAG: hypothetical protein Q7R97_00025, partial [Candidatus Daviesbacteria bacterium]|nr:hypothetical protein [Candidatus Daviesbacteria bacterium]